MGNHNKEQKWLRSNMVAFKYGCVQIRLRSNTVAFKYGCVQIWSRSNTVAFKYGRMNLEHRTLKEWLRTHSPRVENFLNDSKTTSKNSRKRFFFIVKMVKNDPSKPQKWANFWSKNSIFPVIYQPLELKAHPNVGFLPQLFIKKQKPVISSLKHLR